MGLNALRRLGLNRHRIARVLRLWARWQMRGMAPMQATEGMAAIYARRGEMLLIKDIEQALRAGHSVGDALRFWLPQQHYHRILASEGCADFAARLERIALDMDGQRTLWSGWWGRLGYGVLILSATGIVMVVVIHEQVLPALQSLSGGMEGLSTEGQILAVVSSHLAARWWLWPPALLGAFLACRLLARHWIGTGRRYGEKLPGLRWYRLQLGASLLRAAALLVEAGDTWSLAAGRLASGVNGYPLELLTRLQQELGGGRGPVAALQSAGWLSPASGLQLRVLEGDEALPSLAVEIAEEQEEEVHKVLENSLRFVQLLLYALAGAGLLLILSAGRALRDLSAIQAG